jgi:hypothetical protein
MTERAFQRRKILVFGATVWFERFAVQTTRHPKFFPVCISLSRKIYPCRASMGSPVVSILPDVHTSELAFLLIEKGEQSGVAVWRI